MGIFPSQWKEALVVPIPKKNNPCDYSDLRPIISLLPFLSKILESIVQSQLSAYVEANNYYRCFSRDFARTEVLLLPY